MTSLSIPFPKSGKPSIPPKLSSNQNRKPKKKEINDTQRDNTTPGFAFLKRNSRWGNVIEKMSKPGQPPPKATQKHTKDAVIERAKQEGWFDNEEKDRAPDRNSERDLDSLNINSNKNNLDAQNKAFHNQNSRMNLYSFENAPNVHMNQEIDPLRPSGKNTNYSFDDSSIHALSKQTSNSQLNNSFKPSMSFQADSNSRPKNQLDNIQIFAKPRVNNFISDESDLIDNKKDNHDEDQDENDSEVFSNGIKISKQQNLNNKKIIPAYRNQNKYSNDDDSSDSSFSNSDNEFSDQEYEENEGNEESLNLEDSIKREDTFYTNEDNANKKVLNQDDFQAHNATTIESSGKSSNFEEESEDDSYNKNRRHFAEVEMFSPTDDSDKNFDEDDDDVNLSSSNEQFNQTQIINKNVIKKEIQKKSSQVRNSNENKNQSISFVPSSVKVDFEPTPVSLSNEKISYNPKILNDSVSEDNSDDGKRIQFNNKENLRKTSEISVQKPSSRVFNVQSSTDSWGPLEPEDDLDNNNPFIKKEKQSQETKFEQKSQNQKNLSKNNNEEDSENSSEEESAPASNLVAKYFYSEQNKQNKKKKQKEKISKKKIEQDTQKELQELREQMEFFKTENEKLRKSRDQLLNEKQMLANERIQFQNEIERKQQEIEEWREEEMQKIRKEKRILERQVRANTQHVLRREQEKEIKALQDQISNMNKQFKLQSSKLKAEVDRLKEKLQSTEEERDLFRDSIKKLEAERIDREFRQKQNTKSISSEPSISENYPSRTSKSPAPSRRKSLGPTIASQMSPVSKIQETDQVQISQSRITDSPATKKNANLFDENREFREYIRKLHQQFNFVDNETAPRDTSQGAKPIQSNNLSGGKIENIYQGNIREIKYANGTVIKMFPNGYQKVLFANGDIKETFSSGKIVYYYYSADTIHITHFNKLEVFQFPNGQSENHYPDADGTKEIIFADKSVKYMNARFGNMYENR